MGKKKELQDLEDQEKKLKKNLSDSQNKVAAQKDALANAESACDTLEKQKKKLAADISAAEDDLQNAKAENARKAEDKFKAQLQGIEDQVSDAERALSNAKSENSKLKQDLGDVEADLDAAEAAVSANGSKLKSLKSELADTRADADDEADARDAADKAAKKAQDDLRNAQKDVDDLEADQKELESKLKRIVADAEGKMSKEAEEKLESDKSRMKELTDQLSAQLDWVRARLAELETENKKMSVMSKERSGGGIEEPKDEDLDEHELRKRKQRQLDDSKLPAWVLTQKRTFTRWCNSFLVERMIRINDFCDDFTDGVKLCQLIECISKKKIRYNKNPRMKAQELENVSAALKFLQAEGIKVVGIGPEDVVDPKIKLILGLIWTVILRYHIASGDDSGSPKAQLLKWIQSKIPEYEIKNFVKDWADGKAICALIEKINPGNFQLPGDFSTPIRNTIMAFNVATKDMKIPQLLEPEDMVNAADELSNMTYLSYFRTWEEENAKKVEREKIERAKQDVKDARAELSELQLQLDLAKSEMFTLRNLARMGTVVSNKKLI